MKKFRFSLRILFVITLFVAIGTVYVLRSIDAATVYDVTRWQTSTCELHKLVMKKRIVGITYGMRALTPTDEARVKLFPHAEEVYDTGSCMPTRQENARVYVCSECSRVREKWYKENPEP